MTMGVFDLWGVLRDALRGGPRTRLSRDEVIPIARAAVENDPHRDELTMTHVVDRDGRLVWIVTQPVVGHRVWVEVDDGTGQVLNVGKGGLR
jgi:hypothetical protein